MDIDCIVTDDTNQKRERLLARLQQRHTNKDTNSAANAKKTQDQEIDELIRQAKEQSDNGTADEETIKQLEEYLSVSRPGWATKRVQDALLSLRKATLEKDRSEQNTGKTFSFAMKRTTEVIDKISPSTSTAPVALEVVDTSAVPDNAIVFNHLEGEDRIVSGQDGFDVKLKSLKNCSLRFAFKPSAVHMQDITDCLLIFLPVESSILMHDCTRLRLFASAQQIRVHTSIDLQLYTSVRGAVILESCKGVQMAPYRVSYNGSMIETIDNDQWKKPSDFDWLAEEQSPNWKILPEENWITEKI